jgi:hypothetical protein
MKINVKRAILQEQEYQTCMGFIQSGGGLVIENNYHCQEDDRTITEKTFLRFESSDLSKGLRLDHNKTYKIEIKITEE